MRRRSRYGCARAHRAAMLTRVAALCSPPLSSVSSAATPEASSSFPSLFDNHLGIRDQFVAFWNVTSAAFASSSGVIGYDLLNEPFVGDPWAHVKEVLAPGFTDKTYLQPMYGEIAQAIRSNDEEHLLFYEPTPLLDTMPFFGGIVSAVGFDRTPGEVVSGQNAKKVKVRRVVLSHFQTRSAHWISVTTGTPSHCHIATPRCPPPRLHPSISMMILLFG
jgi:hypothetical protein